MTMLFYVFHPSVMLLARLLNAAASLVSDTTKFDRGLSQLMHVDLHWLDLPERVKYKLMSMDRCISASLPLPQSS